MCTFPCKYISAIIGYRVIAAWLYAKTHIFDALLYDIITFWLVWPTVICVVWVARKVAFTMCGLQR